MVLAVVLGTFASTALTASADGGSWGVGAQVTATVDTGRKELIFRSTASTTVDPVKMNQITIGNAPWKEFAGDIEHLIVESGIANISCGAGVDLPNLKDVTVGKDVSEIDARAFINSPSIDSFTVVEGNKSFKDGDNKRLLLTADGKTIVHAAFGTMTAYIFPEKSSNRVKDDIIAIGDYAFYGAVKLERIKLSSKIASIGEYAFSGCKIKGDPSEDDAIRVLTIPSNIRIIGAHAFEGSLIEKTSFTYNLNTIGESAFADSTALKYITAIENPVMLIEENAFLNTSLISSTTPIDFNGSPDEWSELSKHESTLAKSRYTMRDPQDTEYIAYDINGGSVYTIPENQNHIHKDTYYHIIEPIDAIKNVDSAGNEVFPLHATKHFAGWSLKEDEVATLSTSLYQAGDILDKKVSVRLYAVWTDKINLLFDANGGTLTEGLSPVKKDDPVESYKLPKAVPTHTKYDFLGWSKDKNATAPDYLPEGTIKLNQNTILYAVWNVNGPYTITADANGGKFSDNTSSKVLAEKKQKDVDYTFACEAPTRDRYIFKGWSYDGNISNNPVIKANNNVTVKAAWEFNGPCYIRYRIDGKVDAAKSLNVAIGETVTVAPAVEKAGYLFKGWRCQGAVYQPGNTFTATKDWTFDAYYEKINPTKDSEISLNKKYEIDAEYGSKLHVVASVYNVPDNYELWLYQNGEGVTGGPVSGGTATVEWTSDKITQDTSVSVKLIDKAGTVAKSDTRPLMSTITVKVKTGFFARLIAFFKGLFGLLPTYEIK